MTDDGSFFLFRRGKQSLIILMASILIEFRSLLCSYSDTLQPVYWTWATFIAICLLLIWSLRIIARLFTCCDDRIKALLWDLVDTTYVLLVMYSALFVIQETGELETIIQQFWLMLFGRLPFYFFSNSLFICWCWWWSDATLTLLW